MLSLASTGNARPRKPQANCSPHSRRALLKSTTDSIVDSSTDQRIIEHLVFTFKHNGQALGHEMTKGPAQLNSDPLALTHTHAHPRTRVDRHIYPDHGARDATTPPQTPLQQR